MSMVTYNGPHARYVRSYSQQVWESAIATMPKPTFRSPQFTIQQAEREPFPVDKSAEAEHDKFVELHYHIHIWYFHILPNFRITGTKIFK